MTRFHTKDDEHRCRCHRASTFVEVREKKRLATVARCINRLRLVGVPETLLMSLESYLDEQTGAQKMSESEVARLLRMLRAQDRDVVANVVEFHVHETDMCLAVFGDNPNGEEVFDRCAELLARNAGRPESPEILNPRGLGEWPASVYVLAGFKYHSAEEWRQTHEEPALTYRLRTLHGSFDVAAFARFCDHGASGEPDRFTRDAASPIDVLFGFSGPYEWLLAQLESFLGKVRG